MTDYFKMCKTAEDVKQLFKKYARDLHPDCNPGRDTTAEFQEMNKQYEAAWERLKNIHTNAEGEQYEKETEDTADVFRDLIYKLLHISGIMIELCGSWLWITGSTYEVREQLKALNFKYSREKQAWYYHEEGYKKHGKCKYSLNEIRNKYGSQKYATRTEDPEKIGA